MKKNMLVCILLLGNFLSIHAQKSNFKYKLFNADSVVIVSHDYGYKVNEDGKSGYSIQFVEKDSLNFKSVKERVKLNKATVVRLHDALTYTATPDVESVSCYNPHHAILLYKYGKCSVIDICLQCRNYSISKDLVISPPLLGNYRAWKKFRDLLTDLNLTYEVPVAGKYGY